MRTKLEKGTKPLQALKKQWYRYKNKKKRMAKKLLWQTPNISNL